MGNTSMNFNLTVGTIPCGRPDLDINVEMSQYDVETHVHVTLQMGILQLRR